MPVYELIVGKGGAKLQAATDGGCVAQDLDRPIVPMARGQVRRPFCGMPMILNNGFDLHGATLPQLCTALSSNMGRKVIDKTGIAGMFDIRLDWSGRFSFRSCSTDRRLHNRASLPCHGGIRLR